MRQTLIHLFWIALLLCPALVLGAPRITVSIAPLHGLVSEITAGVTEPVLIYERQQSPHGTALSPSQLKQVMNADVVVWVGPSLETGLARLILRVPKQASVLDWDDYGERMVRHEARDNVFRPNASSDHVDEAHGHDEKHGDEPGHEADPADPGHEHGDLDPHFWLSVDNARTFVVSVSEHLASVHPEGADRYRANAARLDAELAALNDRLTRRLAPVADQPFIVFHDAFQYFERDFKLNALGSVVVNPSVPPGPRTLDRLANLDAASGGLCLFHEPQFSDRWMQPLVRLLDSARIARVDPLGALQEPGKGHYQALMTRLANDVTGCLETLI